MMQIFLLKIKPAEFWCCLMVCESKDLEDIKQHTEFDPASLSPHLILPLFMNTFEQNFCVWAW